MTGKGRALWAGIALLIAISLSIGTIWVARRAVGADTDRLAEQAVEMALAQRPASSSASDEQARAQMMPVMRGMLAMYPVTVPAGLLLSTVVIASVLMGAYRMAGVPVPWTVSFAACCTGVAGSALVRCCVMLIVVFLMKQSIPAERLLDNSIVPLDAAAFLPEDRSAVWRSAASKIDLLRFVFALGLVAYLVDQEGFAREARKIIWTTVIVYVIWILLGMLWAAAWSFAR